MGRFIKMDLIYDTASDWLMVEGSICDSCEGNTYNIDPNLQLGIAKKITTSKVERRYGNATLMGREYTDTVCILFSACVENFQFYLIEDQLGLKEPYDGVLGMARNHAAHLEPNLGNTTGPLYVENLWSAGVIPENKFSFYFTQPGSESWADLGEPDLTNVRKDATATEVQMLKEDFFWAGYCQGVAIGNPSDAMNTYRWGPLEDAKTEVDGSLYSILDTGSSSLMIGQMYYDSLIRNIMERAGSGVAWQYQRDYRVLTQCDADLPSIYFMFDSKWLEVSPRDYLF